MNRLLSFVAGALCALAVGYALAQVTQPTLTGNECWQAAQGPGGPGQYVCMSVVRNTQGVQVNNTTTGSIVTTSFFSDVVLGTALTGAVTITLPPSPVPDGFIFEEANGTASAFTQNVVIQPAAGQTLVGGNVTVATQAAGASKEFRYALSTNSWYPFR
jgi:hypothetical protein